MTNTKSGRQIHLVNGTLMRGDRRVKLVPGDPKVEYLDFAQSLLPAHALGADAARFLIEHQEYMHNWPKGSTILFCDSAEEAGYDDPIGGFDEWGESQGGYEYRSAKKVVCICWDESDRMWAIDSCTFEDGDKLGDDILAVIVT